MLSKQMANKNHKTIVPCWIFILVACLGTISLVCADRTNVFDTSNFKPSPKGTVKSIEVPECGDIIDCVDIHKQPAFDHPLMKNLQVNPELMNDDEDSTIHQNWHKHGECPKGTIPIRRNRHDEVHKKMPNVEPPPEIQEFGKVITVGAYQGGIADIQFWNPKVEGDEFSAALITLGAGSGASGTLTEVEAGWIVYPKRYHDSRTRLFIHWTNDNYRSSGCFDLDCPGFVQINQKYALGVPLGPLSDYNKTGWGTKFHIVKDPKTGDWYFKLKDTFLGYWPGTIVPLLLNHAETVVWGGEVLNNRPQNHHTTTQMGSGHFSTESYNRSALMRFLEVYNQDYVLEDASIFRTLEWEPKCYSVTIGKGGTTYNTHFFFGGPGYSQQCP